MNFKPFALAFLFAVVTPVVANDAQEDEATETTKAVVVESCETCHEQACTSCDTQAAAE
jgi:predicted alpha-1,6-mannanase (GH76 family)